MDSKIKKSHNQQAESFEYLPLPMPDHLIRGYAKVSSCDVEDVDMFLVNLDMQPD